MNKQFSNSSIYDTTIRLLILLLIIGWCIMLLLPFANILLWSIILAIAINPLHSKIAEKMGGKFWQMNFHEENFYENSKDYGDLKRKVKKISKARFSGQSEGLGLFFEEKNIGKLIIFPSIP